MDQVVSSALGEICLQGANGLAVSSLWPKLAPILASSNLDLSPSVKTSIWVNLLKVPAIQFEARGGAVSPTDPSIQRAEDAEKVNLKVVAKQSLRDNFIGLYDAQSAVANISARQRETLERLAVARESGVTQSQLGKEFGIDGKDVFYIVKNLESRGLIVRQSATLRRREACGEGESKSSLAVTTNNLYLYRYAKPLGSQQKLEITSEERADNTGSSIESLMAGESLPEDLVKEDVIVKDYLPAMRAVYDMLKAAENKVLVVADIKQNLGYRGGPLSHKAWRTVCNRLKDAGIVEEFDAKVNEKVQSCLRLLKKFPIDMSESNISGCGDNDANSQAAKFGRTHRMSQQVVELPIEHQAFDMITAEGAKGLTLKEVCERLGLNNKRNHIRLVNMCSRFGMHLAADNNRKGMIYRAWAPGFFNPDASGASQIKSGNLDSGNRMSNQDPDNPPPSSLQCLPLVSGRELTTARKIGKRETVAALPCRSVDGNRGNIETDLVTQEEESCEPRSPVVVDAELVLVVSTEEKGVVLSEMSPDKTSNKSVIDKRYPRLSLTPDCIRREQRILERVQKEKFILRAELYKWLVSLEKDKCTTMDRKTIDRIVNKLQKEGQCKCVHINIPSVTNCSRGRISQVILHPSIKDISPFLNEIHERVRAFEISSRGHSSSRLKNLESIPVLEGIQRIPNPVSDAVSGKSEAMRANGFVLAKMVRTKLLHCFLWDYVQSSLNSSSDLSNYHVRDIDNPHSSYSLFSLDEAIKAIPLELFLQVAGSTQTFDDMVQKCKNGLRLSDLPLQEYRILMDTLATGRLSKLIDILRRLKLIRLVNNGETGDGTQVTHATVTHSLELKPYIEEPLSIVTKSFNFVSHDLRPRIRHDFILSNKEAVDEYWQTLEYCYAATDPKAAVHSFPGSAVHEVFFFRSWASARVMTAEQREELLKRVTRDNINEKLSYKECEKIATDLNLTLEQVLRVYYDRRNKRLNNFEKAKRKAAEGPKPTTHADASRKRKRSVKLPPKRSNEDAVSRLSNNENNAGLSEWADNCRKDPANSVDSAEAHDEEDPVSFVKPGQNTQSEGESSKKMKPKRQQRSPWTEEADRQVLMQYVRHRAARGAKCQRADWSLISDLPAKPKACAKRVASLKKNKVFRKALMRLCNILSERYVKHLQKMQRKSQKSSSGAFVGSSTKWNDASDLFSEAENSQLTGLEKEQWDDFNCKSIKTVLEEVLRFKRMSRLEALRVDQSDPENMDYQDPPGSPTSPSQDIGGVQGCGNPYSQRRTRRHLHKKLTNLFVGGIHVNRHIKDSLAVSNAVELFKLIFLNTSTAPEVPNLLAESLRRYSEHDLFAAFSYLRERKIMMGGNTSQQYELSQTFIHNISKSMFPAHTGRRISLFSSWLRGREKDLNEGEVVLADDLQCGDVVQLFGLVSSGELSISPRLPEDGVGEAEDWRNMKRGANDDDVPSNNNKKKLKSVLESEVAPPRREKGFPGIQVSVHRETFLRARAVELMKHSQHNSAVDHIESTSTLSADTSAVDQAKFAAIPADYMKELLSSADKSSTTINTVTGMNWESISCYAENMMPVPSDANCKSFFCPEVFKAVFAAIQRAGDQGLSMEEVSEIAGSPGEEILELFIEVLHSFGLVVKVNGFDAVRIVDALFRSKYLLTSFTGPSHHQSIIVHHSPAKSLEAADLTRKPENNNDQNQRETHTAVNSDQMHRVTILNLPEETDLPTTTDAETSCVHGSSVLGNTVQARSGTEGETYGVSSNAFCMPIVPWINGDGTINKVVYRGLVRRVLGVVMLNPGILEENIIQRMDVLNPQGCRRLLELLVLDKHLIVRKMQESTKCGPPSMLRALLGGSSSSSSNSSSSSTYREHFFANPMSGHLL